MRAALEYYLGGRDPAVSAWGAAVVANGGSVSAGQMSLVGSLVDRLKPSGAWALIDDCWLLCAESATQTLTSLKQRRLATAINSPTFTANRDYTFDGATNDIDTGFVPSTHCIAATTDNVRIDVYERTNVSASSVLAAGTTSATGSRSLRINPRNGTTASAAANTNQAGANFDLPVADSRGLTASSRNAASAAANVGYKNGVALNRSVDATAFGTTLPSHSLFLGAVNQVGVAASFRACSLAWVSIGASLSAAQELAVYNAVQAYMTAKGAQV